MIRIEFSPNEVPIKQPVAIKLNITNSGTSSISKFFLALNFPQSVKFLQGPRRVEIENLAPAETYTVSLQLLCEYEGDFFLTGTNHSYRKGGMGHRIKDLQVPIKFIQQTKSPEPLSKSTSSNNTPVIPTADVRDKPLGQKRKAFISYSRKDQDFAKQLAKSMLQIGFDVWLDIEDIPAGIKWSTAIQNALQTSEIMLVILSPDSMASVNVEDEWQYFLDRGKAIIPILWRPCEIHFQLSRLQYVDFAHHDFVNSFNKLIAELGRSNINLQAKSSKTVANSTGAYSEKLRILFLAANPITTGKLRLDEEIREIDNRLLLAKYRDRFDIKQAWAVRHRDLSQALQRYEPHIVHFSGHGCTDGAIVIEDDQGNAHLVPGTSLARLFRVFKDHVRCVVLNACWSAEQANAIVSEIDVVIGMKQSIGDKAAINFASGFYQALGYGQNIKNAFELGCIEIDLALLGEDSTPKINFKEGINVDDLYL
jgi:hypothetical protein